MAWVSMAAGAENKPLPVELLLWRESGRAGEWRGEVSRGQNNAQAYCTPPWYTAAPWWSHFSWEDLSLLTVPKASLLAGIRPLCRDLESLAPMVGVSAGLDCVSEVGQCPSHLELVLTWTLMLLSKPGFLHCQGLRLAQVSWPY